MLHKAGTHIGGIRTVQDVMDRCVEDETTGCLIWGGTQWTGSARAWFSPFDQITTVSGILHFLRFGRKVPKNKRYVAMCGNKLCMAHRERVSRSTAAKLAPPKNPAAKSAAMMAIKRAESHITEEQVELIRAADVGYVAKVADELGIKRQSAWAIARGDRRAPMSGSSVWAWRP